MSDLVERAEQALREAPTYALNRETAQILSAFLRWMPELIAEVKRLQGQLDGLNDEDFGLVKTYRSTCSCGASVQWQSCPTGGWWRHDEHPADGHKATALYDPPEDVDDRGYWVTFYPAIEFKQAQ